ncbi:hypothetical protein ACA910_004762 [Epithemia clementina (nom. ined.)]
MATVLKEIIDPTIKGPTCPGLTTPWEDEQWGELDWKKARRPMKVTSVFSSTKYVHRVLSPQELEKVLDFPLDIIKEKNPRLLTDWLEGRVPILFKVRGEVIHRLAKWSITGRAESSQDNDEDRKMSPKTINAISVQGKAPNEQKPSEKASNIDASNVIPISEPETKATRPTTRSSGTFMGYANQGKAYKANACRQLFHFCERDEKRIAPFFGPAKLYARILDVVEIGCLVQGHRGTSSV